MGLTDVVFIPSKNVLGIFKELFQDNKESSTIVKGVSVTNVLKLVETGKIEEGTLHKLLENCDLHFCETPKEPRNAELEERVTRLRNEQANEEYRSMTRFILPLDKTNNSIGKEVKLASAQMTAVVNFVLTVVGSFCFVYKAVEYALPRPHIPAQVMMGIVTSCIVALADLYFLLKNTI